RPDPPPGPRPGPRWRSRWRSGPGPDPAGRDNLAVSRETSLHQKVFAGGPVKVIGAAAGHRIAFAVLGPDLIGHHQRAVLDAVYGVAAEDADHGVAVHGLQIDGLLGVG